ncbi:hypothetical protein [Eremococcus coleocola]|uniref:hypothetical protein n=1 Tax=Eremococcus coleocola TaxID=88132 RepID=UPI0003FCD801|nr:hypothetical protein [Eremococcus coleocola]
MGNGFKVKGLDKLEKQFKELEKNASKINGKNEVSFDELFTNNFMQKYTDFSTIDEFENRSSFDFSNLEQIDDMALDNFVSEHTTFSNWKDMLTKASELWTAKKLGF